MRIRSTATITVCLLAATLTACSSDSDDKAAAPEPSATVNQADIDAARKAAGLPPRPDAATTAAYIKALDAIDRDIVHGKTEKAVSRGSDTCGLIKRFPGDEAKQADQTNQRWSSPTHPDGHGLATAKKILTVTHKHLCPDF
ncbi:hypothetical protein ACWCXC_17120 [Streptomyces sp. NPDC001515]